MLNGERRKLSDILNDSSANQGGIHPNITEQDNTDQQTNNANNFQQANNYANDYAQQNNGQAQTNYHQTTQTNLPYLNVEWNYSVGSYKKAHLTISNSGKYLRYADERGRLDSIPLNQIEGVATGHITRWFSLICGIFLIAVAVYSWKAFKLDPTGVVVFSIFFFIWGYIDLCDSRPLIFAIDAGDQYYVYRVSIFQADKLDEIIKGMQQLGIPTTEQQ